MRARLTDLRVLIVLTAMAHSKGSVLALNAVKVVHLRPHSPPPPPVRYHRSSPAVLAVSSSYLQPIIDF